MAAPEVALNTPLAETLQNIVQAKLVEAGWSGSDDTGLAEYVILMLVNGKTQEQVAAELSADLLEIQPDDPSANDFSRWLFEQLEALSSSAASAQDAAQPAAPQDSAEPQSVTGDSSMAIEGAGETVDSSIPTGPKSMRNNGPQRGRNMRMLGQMNKNMTRTGDASLHRIKGTANTGRINAHANRDGPRGSTPRGPKAGTNRFTGSNGRNAGIGGGGRGGGGGGFVPPDVAGAANPLLSLSPEQQMQMYSFYADQARQMASILSPGQQQMLGIPEMDVTGLNPATMQQGKSLFDRVQQGGFKGGAKKNDFGGDSSSLMEVEHSSQAGITFDASKTMCKYNLYCTKPDCPFVHQAPGAPPGTSVDMNDECSFGAHCKNYKCTAKHPSPAQRGPPAFVTEQQCKYYPNCTNPSCHFVHPMPPCRNGGDCTKPDCKYAHTTLACKFNPCLNPVCTFKHAEGQKRGKFEDKVWVNPNAEEGQNGSAHHLSERKFVDEDATEELILPGRSDEAGSETAG